MDNAYLALTDDELVAQIDRLQHDVDALAAKGLALDMARGKPSPEQVELSRFLLDALDSSSSLEDGGADASNYGVPDGLPGARALMAELMGVPAANVVVAGSSSLNLMYDCVAHGFVRGVRGAAPQCAQGPLRFLCPAPGYDRHFAVTAHFGFENVAVPMTAEGPDMDVVEQLVADPAVKGIWCVPKYQNPCGITYSDATVRRMAALKPAAPDFRVYWDNAYVVHDLYDEGDELLNIFDVLAQEGRDDLVYEFASTSKVTFPGSGIAAVAASAADLADLKQSFALERVCPDKISQLMHVRAFADVDAVRAHMARLAEVLRPRFELVERRLTEGLGDLGVATWTTPQGGYFVSFEGPEGSASRIVELCRQTGVTLTGAGATWPGGNDPADTNIRIAPSYPALAELDAALEVFCACARLVAAQLAAEARGLR